MGGIKNILEVISLSRGCICFEWGLLQGVAANGSPYRGRPWAGSDLELTQTVQLYVEGALGLAKGAAWLCRISLVHRDKLGENLKS